MRGEGLKRAQLQREKHGRGSLLGAIDKATLEAAIPYTRCYALKHTRSRHKTSPMFSDSEVSFDVYSEAYVGEDSVLAVVGGMVMCGINSSNNWGEGVERVDLQRERDGGEFSLARPTGLFARDSAQSSAR